MKLWVWWIVVIAVVSGPWYGIVREPQWHRVTWIPFQGLEDKPQDIAANFLMWVPFGLSFAAAKPARRGIAGALAAALGLSLSVEIPQLFYRLRDPSATDVLMALCGTAAGAVAVSIRQRRFT